MERKQGGEDASDGAAEQAAHDVATKEMVAPSQTSQNEVHADDWVDFLISHVPACAHLQPPSLAKVLKGSRAFVLDPGVVLVRENETVSGKCIWIVLDGMLQVTRTAMKFLSVQQQLVQRVVRKKACIDPAPIPADTARVFHTGVTVRITPSNPRLPPYPTTQRLPQLHYVDNTPYASPRSPLLCCSQVS